MALVGLKQTPAIEGEKDNIRVTCHLHVVHERGRVGHVLVSHETVYCWEAPVANP
jgi:hypothetical protein